MRYILAKIYLRYNIILINNLNYKLNLIVVEYDGKLIKKNFYKTTYILNNSNIEILTIVGGG